MMSFLIGLIFLTGLFWIGFKLTDTLLALCLWLFIQVPLGVLTWIVGLFLCCTIILIPLGLRLFKTGFKLLVPGV